MGRFNSKVVFQKCMFFTNIGIDYPLKTQTKLLSIMHRLRIKKIHIDDFFKRKKLEVLVIPIALETLLYLTPSYAKGKFL